MDAPQFNPPKWPLKFLRFFLNEAYVEEIEGDLEEMFYETAAGSSRKKASQAYAWEVLRLVRPILIRSMRLQYNFYHYPMFRNYFKSSTRSLLKNPMTSFINVFGLAVAIGICLLVYSFLEYDYNIDQFHKHKNEVYLITYVSSRDGVDQQYGTAPRPLAEQLKIDFPAIRKYCRVQDDNVVMKHRDNVFHERVRYTDASFLEMFTFPLKWGQSSSLADPNAIILSEDMSKKYFGDDNPVGRDMLMVFTDGSKKLLTVGGVAATFPKSRDIDFNFLVNFDNLKLSDRTYDVNDWSKFLDGTLVQIDDPTTASQIQGNMDKYRRLQNQAQPDWAVSSFALEPLATLHRRAANIRHGIAHDYNVEGRIGMPIIAIFMIVLACCNYINIAIASATKRLKEIGVRKVIGANRGKVVVQFLSENLVVTLFALVIGVALCGLIFMPWFVQFTGWDLELKLVSADIWLFLMALVLFTSLASGFYPALYVARFDAVKIFKGSVQFGQHNPLTRLFLGAQLILACMTITAGVVFTQNNDFQNTRSWGYDQKHALYVAVHDKQAFKRMEAALSVVPGVVSTAGSVDHIGSKVSTALLKTTANRQHEVDRLSVDAHYFETMGLQLAEGRRFTERAASDKRSLIVNELLVHQLGLENPLGKQFDIDSVRYEIVGVVKDFHTKDFFSRIHPTVFTMADEEQFRYLSLHVESDQMQAVNKKVQATWSALYPEIPLQGGYQEGLWATYFHSVNRSETFNKVIASVAVMLASLGLYGLVTLNVSGRVKEFSIRKTLGAGWSAITSVIMKQYVWLTMASLVIGVPVSYWFTQAYLDMLFAYPMPMGYSGIIVAIVILIFVLLTVISTQIRRVLKLNPVVGLKAE